MNLKKSRTESPEIILTPLIDVVFLLLIFFMVSTTFQRDSELTIELPEATSEAVEAKDKVIQIAIDLQGRYYVDGVQLINTQLATVKQALLQASQALEDPQIVISADAQTPHQAVVTVMDAASQLGLVHLTFATRLVEEDGED